MFLALLLSSVFASDSPLSSEAVFGQMRAASAEIKTLSFEFRCTESFTRPNVDAKGSPKTTEKNFVGKAWFGGPCQVRVEFSEGAGLDFNVAAPRASKIAVSDRSVSRLLETDRKSGFTKGTVTEGFTAFNLVPGLSEFWVRGGLEFDNKYLQFAKITASQQKTFIRLAGRGLRETEQIEWDVDPTRGFSFVRKKRDFKHALGRTVSDNSYELLETRSGIWIPRHVVIENLSTGQIAAPGRIVADLLPETVKVNEKLPDKIFELSFPTGSEVTNTNQRTTSIQGGGTSRSRDSVAKLAKEAKQYDAEHPVRAPDTASPVSGALTSESSGRSTWFWIGFGAIITLLGGVYVATRGRLPR